MLLASTGLRATEALSIRLKDLDIDSNNDNNNPGKVNYQRRIYKNKS